MRVTKHQVGKKNKKHVTKKNRKSRNGKIMKGGAFTKDQEDTIRVLIYICLSGAVLGIGVKGILALFPTIPQSIIELIYHICRLVVVVCKGGIDASLYTTNYLYRLIKGFVDSIVYINTKCPRTAAFLMGVAVAKSTIPDRLVDVTKSITGTDLERNSTITETFFESAYQVFGNMTERIVSLILFIIKYLAEQSGQGESTDFPTIVEPTTSKLENNVIDRLEGIFSKISYKNYIKGTTSPRVLSLYNIESCLEKISEPLATDCLPINLPIEDQAKYINTGNKPVLPDSSHSVKDNFELFTTWREKKEVIEMYQKIKAEKQLKLTMYINLC